jgi:hypothetical protein
MTFEYKQTENELLSFYKYHYWYAPENKHGRLWQKIKYGMIATIPCLLFIWKFNEDTEYSLPGVLFFLLFFFALGFSMAKGTVMRRVDGMINNLVSNPENNEFVGDTRYEFLPEGIFYNRKLSEGRYAYEAISKVAQDDKCFYLYTSMLSAIIIPKAAFKGPDEISAFQRLLKERIAPPSKFK